MNILIIEDDENCVLRLGSAVANLGKTTICTLGGAQVFESEDKWELCELGSPMPPLDEVVALIQKADLVLLDENLGESVKYSGNDLLPHCAGKKVIGISRTYDLGDINFAGKGSLDRPNVVKELQDLIAEVMGQ